MLTWFLSTLWYILLMPAVIWWQYMFGLPASGGIWVGGIAGSMRDNRAELFTPGFAIISLGVLFVAGISPAYAAYAMISTMSYAQSQGCTVLNSVGGLLFFCIPGFILGIKLRRRALTWIDTACDTRAFTMIMDAQDVLFALFIAAKVGKTVIRGVRNI